MTTAYVALGSNLDDPPEQLRQAVLALAELPQTQLNNISHVYSSAAVGPGAQPDYLNAVARLSTELSALSLLDHLQQIENTQGRVRDLKWGPRTLDLDLLLYGAETIALPRLSVPHPHMQDRHFVLYPLRDVSGDALVLPDGSKLTDLLQQCAQAGLTKTQYTLSAAAAAPSQSR